MKVLEKINSFFTKNKRKKIVKEDILFEDILLDILVNLAYDSNQLKKYLKKLVKNYNVILTKKERSILVEKMLAINYDFNYIEKIKKYVIRKNDIIGNMSLAYSVILDTNFSPKRYNNYFYEFIIRSRYTPYYCQIYEEIYKYMEKEMLIRDNLKIIEYMTKGDWETEDSLENFSFFWNLISTKEKINILSSKKSFFNNNKIKIEKINQKKQNEKLPTNLQRYNKFILIFQIKNDNYKIKKEFYIDSNQFKYLKEKCSKNYIFNQFCLEYNYFQFNEESVEKFNSAYNKLKERKYKSLIEIKE